MDSVKEDLLKLVRLLSNHPNDVEVKRSSAEPTVFEISVRSEDLKEANSYLGVIQAIVVYTTGLSCDQFEVRILGK